MEEYLTSEQVAALLRLHVKRVQGLARAGRLPGVRIGRKWLFRKADVANRLHPGRPLQPERMTVEISARNLLRGRVAAIALGDVMAEIRMRIGDQDLVSVITRSSAERLGLRVGDEVLAIIKATEVIVGKG
jgi:molybdopterin-binding protein